MTWIYFKYRNPNKPRDPLFMSVFIGFLAIAVIVTLDFIDILGEPGETWLAQGYNWMILLAILVLVFFMNFYYLRKLKPLSPQKVLQKSLDFIYFNVKLRPYDNSKGGLTLPVYVYKVIETKGGGGVFRPLTSTVSYYLVALEDLTRAICGLDTYTGYPVELVINPSVVIIDKIYGKEVSVQYDHERSELEQGLSGATVTGHDNSSRGDDD